MSPLSTGHHPPTVGWLVGIYPLGDDLPVAVVAAALAYLAVHNVVVNEVAPGPLYVPLNLAGTAVLLSLARVGGLSRRELGLDGATARRGLRLGGLLSALVAVGLAAGALVPGTRRLFEDQRVAGLSPRGVVYQALVRVPLGTAVLEETAFRGALPALLGRQLGVGGGAAVASGLFGLWHVLPTLSAIEVNELAAGPGRRALLVSGSVVGTAAGGWLLWLVRRQTDSLLAPLTVHAFTNAAATLAAWLVQRAR